MTADGSYTRFNGDIQYWVDLSSHADYFYADLVSGGYLTAKNGGYYLNHQPTDIQEYNLGVYYVGSGYAVLHGDSFEDSTYVRNGGHASSWYDGQTGFTWVRANTGLRWKL